MRKFFASNIFSISLYFVLFASLLLVFSCKQNMHLDELLSYGLANNEGAWIIIADDIQEIPSALSISDYLESDGHLNIRNVWYNQMSDCHPPLYYLILHSICTLFPNSFSLWYAGIINIVFLIITFFFFRKLLTQFVDNPLIINILSVGFILSPGILATTVFLRMYVMAMAFVTFITYYMISLVENELSYIDCLLLLCATTFGTLTHYYFLMYAGIISVVFLLYLLINRQFKKSIKFSISMLCGVILAYAAFPTIIEHLFLRGRGSESVGNLVNFSDILYRLKSFGNIIENEMFGGLLKYFVILSIIHFFIKKLRHQQPKTQIPSIKYILIFMPSAIYFILVAKMAPFETERYLFPIFAIMLAGILCSIYLCLQNMHILKTTLIPCLLIAIFIGCSYHTNSWGNLYYSSREGLVKSKLHSDSDCICIYNLPTYILPSYLEIKNYKSTTYYQIDNVDKMNNFQFNKNEPLIVVLPADVDDEYLNIIKNKYPLLTNCEFVTSNGGCRSYMLSTK